MMRIPELRFIYAPMHVVLSIVMLWFVFGCSGYSSVDGQKQLRLIAYPSDDGIEALLATTMLRRGEQRLSFMLIGPENLITSDAVTLKTKHLSPNSTATHLQTASYYAWPYASRGAYSAQVSFDEPGYWQIDISVGDRTQLIPTRFVIWVEADSVIPDIGDKAPKSHNKVLSVKTDIDSITTAFNPDPDFYGITIKSAIETGKPCVIVFSSPAFCTSPTCGPQVETLSELKKLYSGKSNFVHIEIYDNPEKVQGNLDHAQLSPTVLEWRLDKIPGWRNESLTFLLDGEGIIRNRFEGYVTLQELEIALNAILFD
jgi:hypothetical protein